MQKIISTGLCSPCRGITISGTGSDREGGTLIRGRLEKSQIVALVLILYNMY